MSVVLFLFILLFWMNYKNTVGQLEQRISNLEAGNSVSTEASADEAALEMTQPMPLPTQPTMYGPEPAPMSSPVSAESPFLNWLKEDLMMKLGALLLILAFGWFVSYAMESGWIGPLGQIAIGLIVGALVLVLGVWRINTHPHQGGIFTVLGGTIVLMTTFAAREVYDLFTPTSALLLMFLTVAFVAFVSVRYQRENISYAGLIMAMIAPTLTATADPSPVGLFSYLLVVTLGALWVVWITGWTRVTFASLVFTYLWSLAVLGSRMPDKYTLLMFAFVFVAIYFLANMVSLIRRNVELEKHLPVHLLTALGTVVFLLTWVESTIEQHWISLVYTAWALVFAVGTYTVYRLTSNQPAFYLYGASAIALLGLATAAELQGPVLVLAFFFEIGALLLAAYSLKAPAKTLSYLGGLLFVPLLMALESVDSYDWSHGFLHQDAIVVLLSATISCMAGILLLKRTAEGVSNLIANILLVASGFYSMAFVWLTLHAILTDTLAVLVSLVIYTIAGIFCFVQGTANENTALRYAGIVLIGLVVLRLLLIDVWAMSLGMRIFTFLAVGILLISTAFIKKHR